MRLLILFVTLLLSACGFHLRGHSGMPFEKLHIVADIPGAPFISELRRNLEDNKVKLVDTAEQADVVLHIVAEVPGKQILTLGGDGRVNEFRLSYRVSLRAYDLKQQDWVPAEDIALHRDYSYDDARILAKEAEENLLYQSMRSEMVQRIMRRLSRAKPLQK